MLPSTTPPPEYEYAVVQAGGGCGLVSLAFFGLALGSRFLVDLVPDEWFPSRWWRLLAPGIAVPLLAGIGLLAGLGGLRSERARSFSRVGVFLNIVALALSLLAIAAFFWILPD